jgi:hypothetical protein
MPACYQLLVDALEILCRCQSLWDLESFAIRHQAVFTESLT